MVGLGRGDRVALARTSRLVSGFLARYRNYAVTDDARDDVRQDALVALCQRAKSGALRDPRAFVSYTGAVVRNLLLARIRSEQRKGRFLAKLQLVRELGARSASRTADPDLQLDLQRAFAGLDDKERLVLDALFVRGLSYADAAEELGLPLGTLKRIQVRGLRALREGMGLRPDER